MNKDFGKKFETMDKFKVIRMRADEFTESTRKFSDKIFLTKEGLPKRSKLIELTKKATGTPYMVYSNKNPIQDLDSANETLQVVRSIFDDVKNAGGEKAFYKCCRDLTRVSVRINNSGIGQDETTGLLDEARKALTALRRSTENSIKEQPRLRDTESEFIYDLDNVVSKWNQMIAKMEHPKKLRVINYP